MAGKVTVGLASHWSRITALFSLSFDFLSSVNITSAVFVTGQDLSRSAVFIFSCFSFSRILVRAVD